jgi:hypothetical protein
MGDKAKARSGAIRQLSDNITFPSKWPVRVDDELPPLSVALPALTLQQRHIRYDTVPKFLRLDLRNPGLLGKLGPRPVLKKALRAGALSDSLTVPASVKAAVTGPDPVSVSGASLTAFRWYRLSRSTGSLFSAAAAVIGALLVAIGAIPGAAQGLLIAGVVLTVLAAAVPVVSAWRAAAD